MSKELTPNDIRACELQGKIFEASLNNGYSSAIFIRRFMFSSVAERFDKGDMMLDNFEAEAILDQVDSEFVSRGYGKAKFGGTTLYWIGYVYRYWNLAFGMSSRRIYSICNATEMNNVFWPYHSLDPETAILRIMEAKKVSPGPMTLQEMVNRLREFRAKKNAAAQ